MPTIPELEAIYQQGEGRNNMDPIFLTAGTWLWLGQLRDASSAWYFDFNKGQENWPYLGTANNGRALAVRSVMLP